MNAIISKPSTTNGAMKTPDTLENLLARASTMTCANAAQTFMALVPQMTRFQIALETLLPLLSDPGQEIDERVQVAYILHALYAPYPIEINPFRSALLDVFSREREIAIKYGGSQPHHNEQFIWVLWKILKGQGEDLAPYTAGTLAISPVPPKLRARNLVLEDMTSLSHADTFSSEGSLSVPHPTPPQTQPTPTTWPTDHDVARGVDLLEAANGRVLTLSEQRFLTPLIQSLTPILPSLALDLPALVAHNLALAHPVLRALLAAPGVDPGRVLVALARLPPALPSYDLLGRLLQDPALAGAVRVEVLGPFVHGCIEALERAEDDEREGLVSDDRFATGVKNLCRFYGSLIKMHIVDPGADLVAAEMQSFALRHARFEEAQRLYGMFVNVGAANGEHEHPMG